MLPVQFVSQTVLAMHAPDGLFSMSVNIVFAVIVAAVVGAAMISLLRRSDHRLAPTMGVMAAFIFAAQMVNFPVASGTTGHLLGGTLAAILLGPWAGTVVMAVVIVFQALLGDGGITVLGPNIFNMGVIGTCMAYFVYRAVVGRNVAQPSRIVAAGFFAAWLAVVLASVFVSLQLAVSGTASLERAFTAMVLTHMAIGVGEALITAGVLAFVLKTRPDLIYQWRDGRAAGPGRAVVVLGLGASLAVGVFLSLLPNLWDYPDGLESVGIAKGFIPDERENNADGKPAASEGVQPVAGARPPLIALLPDYKVPGMEGLLSTSLAGGIGTLITFLISFAVGRVFTRPGRLEAALAGGATDSLGAGRSS